MVRVHDDPALQIVTECVPFDEAVSRIRRTRRCVFLSVGTFARFIVQNPAKPERVLGVVGSGNMRVTRKQAVEFLLDAYPEHHRKKLCLRVAVSRRCMFIGNSPR